jgi:cell filamentation protein, protein adenylyltransferase
MVNVKAKRIRNKTYYYLQSSVREHGKVITKDKYLGHTLPKNIEHIKQELVRKNIQNKYYNTLDKIEREYRKEKNKMPKAIIEKELNTFATQFTYDTQRIEGSTLTLKDTLGLLEWGRSPPNKPTQDIKEAEAHKKLFLDIISSDEDLSLRAILDWHSILFKETKPELAGQLRKYQVGISGSKYKPPLAVEVYPLLQDFFKWYKTSKKYVLSKPRKLHPVEFASLVHLKFVTIHPFGDGNGRISRLMMNFVLNKYSQPMLNISYNKRNSYYSALEKSQVTKNENAFSGWFIKRYIKENIIYTKL